MPVKKLMVQILKLMDFFIPEHLKHSPTDLMKCYVLLGILFSNLFFSFVAVFVLSFGIDLAPELRRMAVGITSLTFVGYTLTLIVFKLSGNVRIASNCFLLVLVITIFPPVLITGGYQQSPIVQMYLLIPVSAFLLTGLINGLIWMSFTVACVVSLAIAYQANWLHVQLMEDQQSIELLRIMLNIMLFAMVAGVLIVYELINENLHKKLNEEKSKFEHRASHDALTSLPNRFEFFRRLNNGLIECANRQQKLAVVYIDLDGFKPVNDQYGHHTGDLLLKTIASRLQAVLRLSDTIARLGGDEFALILPGIHVPADINLVMDKVLQTIKQPIEIETDNGAKQTIQVFGSAGISVYPDHSEDVDTLCKYADSAMYRAKETHDAFVYFEASS